MEELKQALMSSFIDYNIPSKNDLKVQLITNNASRHVKVSYELNQLFKHCDEFYLSVAFIKQSGLAVLKQTLLELEKRNIPGKIITSTYLGFNDPDSFKELLKFKNIEVRIYEKEGFHPKGYIFKQGNLLKTVIGSSNITQSALSTNQE